jgi:hypothetical protein
MTRSVRQCHAKIGRAALRGFATVAEIESLAELSARLIEHGAPIEDEARWTQRMESGDGRRSLEGGGESRELPHRRMRTLVESGQDAFLGVIDRSLIVNRRLPQSKEGFAS